MGMRWHDLLFMHWPVDASVLRPLVPQSLAIDTFEGQAWIAVVPFRMTAVRPRLVPSLPGVSAFLELNVRTYVTADDRPGVWFFSLDAASRAAVRAARWLFHLPYFDARMDLARQGERIEYKSVRTHAGAAPAVFRGGYQPVGPVKTSDPGTLEYWLTERYCMYAGHRNRVHRCEILHDPWPLQAAEAEVHENTMTDWLGVRLPATQPLLHFSAFLDVVGWRPRQIR